MDVVGPRREIDEKDSPLAVATEHADRGLGGEDLAYGDLEVVDHIDGGGRIVDPGRQGAQGDVDKKADSEAGVGCDRSVD